MNYTLKEYIADKPLQDYLLKRMNQTTPTKFIRELQLRDMIHLGLGMLAVIGFWTLTTLL